ncbi:MAG TPA: hypothetical protein VHA06_09125 [Candidatus Angelobacter sp.]|nr:hypothetical protein [Candidatus Angelobacter sp.]
MASAVDQTAGAKGVPASPKAGPVVDERKSGTPSKAIAPVEYKAVDKDGIVASPRLRQQLDERGRGQEFQIAPLK